MMKRLRHYSGLLRVVIATALVLAVSASLWFAAPVKAAEVSIQNLPATMYRGRTYTFYAQFDINTNESIPIIDFRFDIDGPTPAYAVFNVDGTMTDYSPQFVSIELVSSPYYGYSDRYGYGYGYQPPGGYGYFEHQWGYGYGYGYGYGGYAASTLLRYRVQLDTTGMDLGSYTIQLAVNVPPPPKRFLSPRYAFDIIRAPTPPPTPPPPPPEVTDVSDIVDEEGVFTEDVTAESEDGNVSVGIDEGTTGLTAEGEPISEITITEMEDPPAPPEDASIVGLVYDLGPEGATFSDPDTGEPVTITLCFTYNPDDIAEGVDEEDLVLARWDEESGEWVKLCNEEEGLPACSINTETHTICAPVSHFTVFAVLAIPVPEVPVPPVVPKPAAFTASDLSITPAEVGIGETVTISVLVTNTGDLEGAYQVVLKIDNVVIETKDITMAGGASQTVTFTTAKDVAGTYTIDVNGLPGTFTAVKPPPVILKPAAFTANVLTISPAEVGIGETVTISVLVTNTGEEEGTYGVTLKIDGVEVETKEVTLVGDASQKVTFTTAKDVAGTYTISIDELSDTFTVKAPPVKVINYWPLVGGIIGGVIVVGLAIWLIIWWRRRRYSI